MQFALGQDFSNFAIPGHFQVIKESVPLSKK
jgi:hypothetical protein